MVEKKRFYYNTFYHADDMSRVLEYEIIDRQSYPNYPHYDEKEDIPNWYIYIGENDSGWQDMLVDLLNELAEENGDLKNNIGEQGVKLDFAICETQDFKNKWLKLKKENEQLKKRLIKLKAENVELKEENEKLWCDGE